MAEPLEIEASPKIPRALKAHKVLKTYNEGNVKWSFTSLLKKQTRFRFSGSAKRATRKFVGIISFH